MELSDLPLNGSAQTAESVHFSYHQRSRQFPLTLLSIARSNTEESVAHLKLHFYCFAGLEFRTLPCQHQLIL
jgi:hypothetical protein